MFKEKARTYRCLIKCYSIMAGEMEFIFNLGTKMQVVSYLHVPTTLLFGRDLPLDGRRTETS
jgi:hypothetical protein